MYSDISALNDASQEKSCLLHQGGDHPCSLRHGDVDLFVAGFPCKPFSVLNWDNFQRDPEAKSLHFTIPKDLWDKLEELKPSVFMGDDDADAGCAPGEEEEE